MNLFLSLKRKYDIQSFRYIKNYNKFPRKIPRKKLSHLGCSFIYLCNKDDFLLVENKITIIDIYDFITSKRYDLISCFSSKHFKTLYSLITRALYRGDYNMVKFMMNKGGTYDQKYPYDTTIMLNTNLPILKLHIRKNIKYKFYMDGCVRIDDKNFETGSFLYKNFIREIHVLKSIQKSFPNMYKFYIKSYMINLPNFVLKFFI